MNKFLKNLLAEIGHDYTSPNARIYNNKQYFTGGLVTTPKRGLVDGPGSYGGELLTDEILLERLKNNKGKKTYTQIAEELNKEGFVTRAGKITDAALEQRAIRGNFPKGLASRFDKESIESLYEVSTPENIKLFEESKISEKLFRRRAISRRQDLKRTHSPERKVYLKDQGKKWRDNPANFEKIKQNTLNSKIEMRKKYGMTPPAANAKEELWRSLFTDAQRHKPGRRLKTIGEYKGSITREQMYNSKILDTKTGKVITFNPQKIGIPLEKYITLENTGFTYKQVIKPYDQKWFINDTPGLRKEINQKLIKGWTEGSTVNFFEIQHNAGRWNDPFDVSLSNRDVNQKEHFARKDFEKKWNEANNLDEASKRFGAKKTAFKNFIKELPKGIASRPGIITRRRLLGEDVPFSQQLKNLEQRGIKIDPEVLKKSEKIGQLLGDLGCGKAGGGRIKFANGSSCIRKGLDIMRTGDVKDSVQAKKVMDIAKEAGNPKKLKSVLRLLLAGTGVALVAEEIGTEALVAANGLLKGKPFKESWADSYLSYVTHGINKKSSKELAVESFKSPSLTVTNEIQNIDEKLYSLEEKRRTELNEVDWEIEGSGSGSTAAIINKRYDNEKKKLLNKRAPLKNSLTGGLETNINLLKNKLINKEDAQEASYVYSRMSLRDQMEGIPGIVDDSETQDEAGVTRPRDRYADNKAIPRLDIPNYLDKTYLEPFKEKYPDLTIKDLREHEDEQGNPVFNDAMISDLMANDLYAAGTQSEDAGFFKEIIEPKPMYDFARGGIATLAGKRSKPMPHGLDYLMRKK